MSKAFFILIAVIAVALVVGCGLKGRERHEEPEPARVETPEDSGEDSLDIDAKAQAAEAEETLPMGTEFLEWGVAVDESPRPARIEDRLTRTLTFTLTNTLERLLTGQIVIEAPQGVLLVPGPTIGWRVRGGRSARFSAQLTIIEGAPLGRVTLPVAITVLNEQYASGELDVVKWLDVRVIGPFPAVDRDALGAVYPPEEKVDFDRGCSWEDETLAWRPLPVEALHPDGMVDMSEVFGMSRKGCAYAALNVYAKAATGVVIAFACDSPSAVWLDGEPVLKAPEPLREESAVEVTLKRGRNTLLVKCCAGETGWAFILNVVGKQGELPAGVRFDVVLRASLAQQDGAEEK
jgi:hypothetical protein